MSDTILIIDYGSQYTQLIARKIREQKTYCVVKPFHKINSILSNNNIVGIVLSGGPNSVKNKKAPKLNKEILNLGIPILGICYGLQLLCEEFKGKIGHSKSREYGHAIISTKDNSDLLKGVNKNSQVWMSHGDHIEKTPKGFIVTSVSKNNVIASIESKSKKIFGLQFHPEVYHTLKGELILSNFLKKICKVKKKFKIENFLKSKIADLKKDLQGKKIICGLSGGVDSTVTSFLLFQAVRKNLYCIFVDHGFLRLNESMEVENMFKKKFGNNFIKVDASNIFLKKLKNIIDPEKKRKIIGKTFIDVFEKEAKRIKNVDYLAQGTLLLGVAKLIGSFLAGPVALLSM